MGFFDRFKKKEEQKVEQKPQPLTLQYSDGSVAEVNFAGLQDDEGKIVHKVNIVYTSKNGSFTSKSVSLEPIPYQDEKGNWVDGTEKYYRQLAQLEDQQTQEAIHLFFDKQEINKLEERSGNYLGNLVKRENGHYDVNYDENYRIKHSQQFQAKKAQQVAEEQARHEQNEAEIANNVERLKTEGIQKQLSSQIYSPEDTTGYAGRLTEEDYKKYFGHRSGETPGAR